MDRNKFIRACYIDQAINRMEVFLDRNSIRGSSLLPRKVEIRKEAERAFDLLYDFYGEAINDFLNGIINNLSSDLTKQISELQKEFDEL